MDKKVSFKYASERERVRRTESLSNYNLENADNARNFLNEIMNVSTQQDKYTQKEEGLEEGDN